MSKKDNKKRKTPYHVKKVKDEKAMKRKKIRRFMNEYGWLITAIIMVLLFLVIRVFGDDIASCADSCGSGDTTPDVVTQTDTSGTDSVKYSEAIQPIEIGSYTAPDNMDASYVEADHSSVEAINNGQFCAPEVGEEIVVLSTKYGDMKIQLFPEYAPLACANFKELVSQNAFDGHSVYSTIPGAYVCFGDVNGHQSVWDGARFEEERGRGLFAFTGAVFCWYDESISAYRFGLIHSDPSYYKSMFGSEDLVANYGYNEHVSNCYSQVGGFPGLDAKMDAYFGSNDMLNIPSITIFGQVYSGNNILNALGSVATDSSGLPVDNITIASYLAEVTWNSLSGTEQQ